MSNATEVIQLVVACSCKNVFDLISSHIADLVESELLTFGQKHLYYNPTHPVVCLVHVNL